MAINSNINIEINNKSQKEFNIEYLANGYGGLIPVINGVRRPDLAAGYTSEADAKAYITLLTEALKATNGDVSKAKTYMMNAVRNAAEVREKAEKNRGVVMIEGDKFIIDFEKRKIYKTGLCGKEVEITNLNNIGGHLDRKTIEEILVDKVILMMYS